MTDDLLSTREAAKALGVTARRVRVLIADKRLPARKVGRDLVIRAADLALVATRPMGRPRKERT